MPEISPLTMTVNLVMHRIMQRSGVPSGLAMLNSQLVRHNIQLIKMAAHSSIARSEL